MAYKIFLIDSLNSIELDSSDIEMGTTFSVADIKDISVRKDIITKQLVFKGTKTNNEAFGSMFHLNRVTDSSLSNKILFNYNPLRTVDCLVYEEGMLLIKGNIRVLEVNVNKGIISYATVITGKFIEFIGIIKEKLLSDLDFSDLKHRYSIDNIRASWNFYTERYNSTTSTFYNEPFQLGEGFIYPYIDYGNQFLINDANATNADKTKFHGLNFKPAIYLKEYLKKIFSQTGLNGWSYEIKGSPEFQDKISSTIIPNLEEKLSYKFNTSAPFFNTVCYKPSPVIENHLGAVSTFNMSGKLMNISNIIQPPASAINPYLTLQSGTNNTLIVNRTITSDGILKLNMYDIENIYNLPLFFNIELVEKPYSTDVNPLHVEWQTVVKKEFILLPLQTIPIMNFNIPIGERKFQSNKNLAVRILINHPNRSGGVGGVKYKINYIELSIPKDPNTSFTADLDFGTAPNYDIITPKGSESVKQLDFLKSVMNLMNLYAYTEKSNPKHLIFQKYDDYYASTSPAIIKTVAIDWTRKIDFENIKIKSNLTLPKSYQFTYRDDSDWLNTEYKKKHGLVYGTFEFNDAYGIVDKKKVELIFSPTLILESVGTGRKFPGLFQLDSGNKKSFKTNIRILYYNGLIICNAYSILKDKYTTQWVTEQLYPSYLLYPQVSTYYFSNSTGLPIEDLNFGRSKEYYFPITTDYLNASTAYQTYYSNQITELTNPNISTIEADVNLNELDITNLNLKIPVYIDLGELGHAYFKVLSVDYSDNKSFAKVVLQKIYLGTKK